MRRALLTALALAALLSSLVGVGGCAGGESTPAADGAAAPSTRPRPELDAQAPAGLQTAVFGLG
jgi:hypothetical protein